MARGPALVLDVYKRQRYDITLPDVLAELTDDLCSSVGSLTNASKIANTLGTVKNISVSSTTDVYKRQDKNVGAAGKCQLTGKKSGFSAAAWNEYGMIAEKLLLEAENFK